MKTPWPRWLVPLSLAVFLGWLLERNGEAEHFMRVPIGRGPSPVWTMSDLDGHPVSSSNYLGNVVVLNFWATWCPPCRKEIPELNAFQKAHSGDGVVVVGASVDEGETTVVRDFVQRMKILYPVLVADLQTQARFGGASTGPSGSQLTLPTTVVIDRKGNYAARYLGAITQEELEKAVKPLLAPSL